MTAQRPDLTEWHRYRATAFVTPRMIRDGEPRPGAVGDPVAERDAGLLYSLAGMVQELREVLWNGGLPSDRPLVLVVPSEGWRTPGAVDGATLLDIPVRLDGRVAWPALQVELRRS